MMTRRATARAEADPPSDHARQDTGPTHLFPSTRDLARADNGSASASQSGGPDRPAAARSIGRRDDEGVFPRVVQLLDIVEEALRRIEQDDTSVSDAERALEVARSNLEAATREAEHAFLEEQAAVDEAIGYRMAQFQTMCRTMDERERAQEATTSDGQGREGGEGSQPAVALTNGAGAVTTISSALQETSRANIVSTDMPPRIFDHRAGIMVPDNVVDREAVVDMIRRHGGMLSSRPAKASVVVVDDRVMTETSPILVGAQRKGNLPPLVRKEWIAACVDQQRLLDFRQDNYLVELNITSVVRPPQVDQNKKALGAPVRVDYTYADKVNIIQHLAITRSPWNGIACARELHSRYGRHTPQSYQTFIRDNLDANFDLRRRIELALHQMSDVALASLREGFYDNGQRIVVQPPPQHEQRNLAAAAARQVAFMSEAVAHREERALIALTTAQRPIAAEAQDEQRALAATADRVAAGGEEETRHNSRAVTAAERQSEADSEAVAQPRQSAPVENAQPANANGDAQVASIPVSGAASDSEASKAVEAAAAEPEPSDPSADEPDSLPQREVNGEHSVDEQDLETPPRRAHREEDETDASHEEARAARPLARLRVEDSERMAGKLAEWLSSAVASGEVAATQMPAFDDELEVPRSLFDELETDALRAEHWKLHYENNRDGYHRMAENLICAYPSQYLSQPVATSEPEERADDGEDSQPRWLDSSPAAARLFLGEPSSEDEAAEALPAVPSGRRVSVADALATQSVAVVSSRDETDEPNVKEEEEERESSAEVPLRDNVIEPAYDEGASEGSVHAAHSQASGASPTQGERAEESDASRRSRPSESSRHARAIEKPALHGMRRSAQILQSRPAILMTASAPASPSGARAARAQQHTDDGADGFGSSAEQISSPVNSGPQQSAPVTSPMEDRRHAEGALRPNLRDRPRQARRTLQIDESFDSPSSDEQSTPSPPQRARASPGRRDKHAQARSDVLPIVEVVIDVAPPRRLAPPLNSSTSRKRPRPTSSESGSDGDTEAGHPAEARQGSGNSWQDIQEAGPSRIRASPPAAQDATDKRARVSSTTEPAMARETPVADAQQPAQSPALVARLGNGSRRTMLSDLLRARRQQTALANTSHATSNASRASLGIAEEVRRPTLQAGSEQPRKLSMREARLQAMEAMRQRSQDVLTPKKVAPAPAPATPIAAVRAPSVPSSPQDPSTTTAIDLAVRYNTDVPTARRYLAAAGGDAEVAARFLGLLQ